MTIIQMQKTIARLKRDSKKWREESVEQRKELEKLRTLIRGYEDLLPEDVFNNLMEPIATYEARCTQQTPTEKKKKEKK